MSEPDVTPDGRTSGDLAGDVVAEVLARLERGENVDYRRILEDNPTLQSIPDLLFLPGKCMDDIPLLSHN